MSDLRAGLDWRDPTIHYASSAVSSVSSTDSIDAADPAYSSSTDVLPSLPCFHVAAPELAAMPSEILELIGFEVACLSRFDQPRDLLSLCLVSKQFHQTLSPKHNHRLYARLFKDRFDLAAVRRRFAPVRSSVLCHEFLRRIKFMSRLKSRVAQGRKKPLFGGAGGEQQMIEDLWMAYLMLLENGAGW